VDHKEVSVRRILLPHNVELFENSFTLHHRCRVQNSLMTIPCQPIYQVQTARRQCYCHIAVSIESSPGSC